MSDHDLEWLAAQRPQSVALDPGVTARRRAELVRHAAAVCEPLPRGRRRAAWRIALPIAAVTALGAAAAVITLSDGPAHAPAPPLVRAHIRPIRVSVANGSHGPLLRLADYVRSQAKPAGDATLLQTTDMYSSGQAPYSIVQLYTDSGKLYTAPTVAGLPAAVTSGQSQSGAFMRRELAAARFAANGDLTIARHRMAIAALDPKRASLTPAQLKRRMLKEMTKSLRLLTDPTQREAMRQKIDAIRNAHVNPHAQTDNEIWENSLDALTAGAGDPQVRAGVLRLVATVNTVTVASTTTAGQPSLTLTATGDAMPANYQEQLIINAKTGLPIQFTGGTPGRTPDVTTTYQVSRVTVASIAAGQ